MRTLRWILASTVVGVATLTSAPAGEAQGAVCPPPAPLTFSPPRYIDTTRAGGEPTIATHPDGTYLVGTHAGSSHFYTPEAGDEDTAAFPQNYRGQAYYYWSADKGQTWHYVDRSSPPANVPGTGYSDPDFAIDTAGQVFISEINLVNIAMSKSTDVGRSYALQNILAQSLSDRQWSDADQKDVVYMSGNSFGGGTSTNPVGNEGHYLYRSTDGGKTFTPGLEDGTGDGDLKVDHRNGTLYEPWPDRDNGTVAVAAYRKARTGDMTREVVQIATGADLPLIGFHSVDVDPHGNVYLSWKDNGGGKSERPAGVYYSYSTDEGRHWAAPMRVDTDDKYDHWPWLTVGDDGHVAIAWLQADIDLPSAETPGFHGWRVVMAQTTSGLGCTGGRIPGFTISTVTAEPMHVGTICDNGTICQAQVVDRRLGDYFTV
ncbi:MAG TPA: hypothetical protein VM030_08150, partial [Acidimicrobiales bacterium]|nr:hypothetical protein [Acidimicrobiales bacterium]